MPLPGVGGGGRSNVIDELFVRIGYKTDAASLRRVDQRLQAAKVRLNALSGQFMRFGLAGAGAMFDVTRTAMKFDKAMKLLEARGKDLTQDQLRFLRGQALDVSSRIGLNADEVVDAQIKLKQLGLEYKAIRDLTPSVANVAFATRIEGVTTEEVAKYASIIMQTFGVSAGDVGEKLDVMLHAATRSPAAFRELGEAMQYSAKTAALAELSFESYIASVAGLAGAGRSPEAASQGLQTIISKFAKAAVSEKSAASFRGTKILTQALKAVNLTPQNLLGAWEGAAKPDKLFAVLDLINKMSGGDTDKLIAIFSVLGGESYAPAVAHLAQNIGTARENTDAFADSLGYADRQARIMMEGLSGKWELLKAGYDTLKNRLSSLGSNQFLIRLMDALNGVLVELNRTDTQGRLVNERLLTMASSTMIFLTSLLALGGALRLVGYLLGGLSAMTRLAAIFRPTQLLTKSGKARYAMQGGKMVPLTGPSQFMRAWGKVVPRVVGFLGRITRFLGGPLAAVAGIAAVGLVKHWKDALDWLKRGLYGLNERLRGVSSDWNWEWLAEGLGGVVSFIGDELLSMYGLFRDFIAWLKDKMTLSDEELALGYVESKRALETMQPELAQASEDEAAAKAELAKRDEALRVAEQRRFTHAQALTEMIGRGRPESELDAQSKALSAADKQFSDAVSAQVTAAEAHQAANKRLAELNREAEGYESTIRQSEETAALRFRRKEDPRAGLHYQGADTYGSGGMDYRPTEGFEPTEPLLKRMFSWITDSGAQRAAGGSAGLETALGSGLTPALAGAPYANTGTPRGAGPKITMQNETVINQEIGAGMSPEDVAAATRRGVEEGYGALGRRIVESFNSEES